MQVTAQDAVDHIKSGNKKSWRHPLRVGPMLGEFIVRAAKEEGVSVNTWIMRACENKLGLPLRGRS